MKAAALRHCLSRHFRSAALLIGAVLTAACSETTSEPVEIGVTPPPTAPVYRAPPPAGKLPWPHHVPSWDAATQRAKYDSVWVVNNFGQYTGTADRSILYMHDALDIVLPNGTPIHAVSAGQVVAMLISDRYYNTMFVEDADRPGFGWAYTHMWDYRKGQGDFVHQGDRLGVVSFQGLEHIHLARVRLAPGGRWTNFGHHHILHPDGYFAFRDDEPPVFEGRFRYVRNDTDSTFTPTGPAAAVVVHGDVDIVVGLRDGGEWTRSKVPFAGVANFGDSHAVARIEYDIFDAAGQPIVRATAFDFRHTYITKASRSDSAEQLLTAFQHYESAQPRPAGGFGAPRFAFYVITNSSGIEPTGLKRLDAADRDRAWRTAERLPDGTQRFPNGEYVVTVRAFDSSGNMATRSDRVRVQN
jgi:hypothetical protein